MSQPAGSTRGLRGPLIVLIAVVLLVTLAAGLFLVRRRAPAPESAGGLPAPGSEAYRAMVSAFHEGVAALDADAADRARAALTRATRLVPEEPAAWADLGLLKLRQGDHDGAAVDLERARSLAPDSAAIEALLGLLESRRGRYEEAVSHLRRSVELDPKDYRSRFALMREVERLGEEGSEADALRLANELSDLVPRNAAVLLERARLAAKREDAASLAGAVERLAKLAPDWPSRAQEVQKELGQALKAGPRGAATRVISLRNLLLPTVAFRRDMAAVDMPVGTVGQPIERFLRLEPPPLTLAPPDAGLTYSVEAVPGPGPGKGGRILAVALAAGEKPAIIAGDEATVMRLDRQGGDPLPFPGRPGSPPTRQGLLAADLDSDYRLDLILAGAGGIRYFHQKEDGRFDDRTDACRLEPSVRNGDYAGAWAADLEMDGDLDLILGAREGKTVSLRNNGDGTFTPFDLFGGTSALRSFAWADLDNDGAPDAVLLDAKGTLRVMANERSGKFRDRPLPSDLGPLAAVAVSDLDGDGRLDLVTLKGDGSVQLLSDRDEGGAWDRTEVLKDAGAVGEDAQLIVADLDNNGGADLIASGRLGEWVRLADGKGGFVPLSPPSGLKVAAVADLNADGTLDLAGLSEAGVPSQALGRGSKGYHWQVIRPKGAKTFGDGRINSFGLGGEVQVRANLLVQKQVIDGPILHFGLGENEKADVARIVWPNGTTQAEFEAKADQELVAEQRLKGSCPFLYAFDGKEVRFVTDFIWRSPLGLRINAQDTAGVAQTEDWVKIRGDQLAPSDGFYDIRITAELWETHFWDHVALMVVDHPPGTDVFVDERFARQPPRLAVQATGPLHVPASARDNNGNVVTSAIARRDGRYLDDIGRGRYQGVARDHWVQVEIGEDLPRNRPLLLVARGWIHPTDSSINVAIGQGGVVKPQGLILEVPTGDGGWKVVRDDLGFPAGKNKTILVDLDGLFAPRGPRKLRLRTNLEIYWDMLAIADAHPELHLEPKRLAPQSAELRFRGYSRMLQADASAPELPDYGRLAAVGQPWRDLVGFYTRFGDVRELLEKVDDRYVIANAGDELRLRFPAGPPPEAGWVRDFVMIGDGWNKDGDYNTAFSRTVLPLPTHAASGYDRPPGALEDDPVFRAHADDWRNFHTRFVTPAGFQRGLRHSFGSQIGGRSEPSP
ncbi:FG-GAP-like repeat-containing protein [Aquisphaera insulae]|uniref:FG-GAP-like repeat-containing protein n=1 Tax=Aquisphaera insulae TaxID=2712864 RepID=UPI0013ED7BE2|nr:FG-GAP-like repeat-containing protein [Aquisphaera insulae]